MTIEVDFDWDLSIRGVRADISGDLLASKASYSVTHLFTLSELWVWNWKSEGLLLVCPVEVLFFELELTGASCAHCLSLFVRSLSCIGWQEPWHAVEVANARVFASRIVTNSRDSHFRHVILQPHVVEANRTMTPA